MSIIRKSRSVVTILAGTLAAAALAAPGAPAAAAAQRKATHAGSPYPSEATRPARAPGSGGRALAHMASSTSKKKPKPALHGNPARALVSFQAMQKAYYIKGSGLYAGEPFSYLWPFSQAFAATVSMSFIPHLGVSLSQELHARLAGLNNYLDLDNSAAPEGTFTSGLPAFDGTVAPPAGPGGAKYYDDNDWVGLELVRLYEMSHAQALLGSAEGIMAFEMAGWQENPEFGCPGGIPFSNLAENNQRNTVTTAPAAELATQLYRLTKNIEYLRFAEKAYTWVRTCLLTPAGLYADHVNRRGVVEPKLWSYNQGSMIGAGTLLYQATHNGGYLYQARQTAKAALAYFTPQLLGEEIPFFASVYFRNLLYLDSVTHDPPGARIAQAYVDYAWTHLREPNYLFVAGSPATAQLLVQSAIVQIYALLSSPPSTYF
ncbi:MAG TPA: glycoside hydrolase family 76 protein [Solirubrobacteraceae bacterium]|nr:glycoside hydrolase family 76 protein [Solirubrobacteraceae bacterium]